MQSENVANAECGTLVTAMGPNWCICLLTGWYCFVDMPNLGYLHGTQYQTVCTCAWCRNYQQLRRHEGQYFA